MQGPFATRKVRRLSSILAATALSLLGFNSFANTQINISEQERIVEVTAVVEHRALVEMLSNPSMDFPNIQDRIAAGVNKANQVLENSGINEFSYQLKEVLYLNRWAEEIQLDGLIMGDADRNNTNVTAAIARGSADRIVYITPTEFMRGAGGWAEQWSFKEHQADKGSTLFDMSARYTQILARGIESVNLAHEIGHTLGLAHERGNIGLGQGSGFFDYALPYGYTSPSYYTTVMSYGADCPDLYCSERLEVYSSPDIVFNNDGMGKDDTHIDAADAVEFIRQTWPLTTRPVHELTGIREQATGNAFEALISWDLPDGYESVSVYSSQSACFPNPSKEASGAFSTLAQLDPSVEQLIVTDTFSRGCIYLEGSYVHKGVTLHRPLGFRKLSQNFDGLLPFIFDKQIYQIEQLGSELVIPFTVLDENINNQDLVFKVPKLNKTIRGGGFYSEALEISNLLSITQARFSGTGRQRTLTISFSNDILSYIEWVEGMHVDFFDHSTLPFKISTMSELNELSSDVYLDFSEIFMNLPNMKMITPYVTFEFNENQAKTTTLIVNNVADPDNIIVEVSSSNPDSTWQLQDIVKTPLGDNRTQVDIAAYAPPDSDHQYAARISVAGTKIETFANFIPITWRYAKLDTNHIVVNEYEDFTIKGAVFNQQLFIDDVEGFNVLFSTTGSENPLVSYQNGSTIERVSDIQTNFETKMYAEKAGQYRIHMGVIDNSYLYTLTQFDLTVTSAQDTDGDGVADARDPFPNDPSEWADSDGDSVGDNSDAFPNNPLETADTDNDGIGNNADTDDDGDGVPDEDDPYPLDPTRSQNNPTAVYNDTNGDGNADILWRNSSTGHNWLWTMNGRSILRSAGINVIADQAWQIAGRGDFDGDGKSDILWRNSNTGRNYIYLMDGHSIKQQGQLNYVNDTNWKVAEVADVDGDGKDDVIWRHATQGRTWIYLMNGMTTKASQGSLTVADLNWEIVASGDINGDDKADVIWRHKTRGDNYVWLMNGTTIANRYVLNRVASSDWTIAGAGDLNGDGTDDIIWRNQRDGRNWAYLMNGGQIQTSALINTVANINWQIADISDLNGDGKADLFWRQGQSGQSYIFLMNGLSVTSAGYSNTVNPVWQVIH